MEEDPVFQFLLNRHHKSSFFFCSFGIDFLFEMILDKKKRVKEKNRCLQTLTFVKGR